MKTFFLLGLLTISMASNAQEHHHYAMDGVEDGLINLLQNPEDGLMNLLHGQVDGMINRFQGKKERSGRQLNDKVDDDQTNERQTSILGAPVPDGCIEVVNFGPVTWTREEDDVCRVVSKKTCVTKTADVWTMATETTCVAQPYTECTHLPTTTTIRNDLTTMKKFTEQICVPGPLQYINSTSMVPQSVNSTKEQCDSKWVLDPLTGEGVWGGFENCRNVTVQVFSMVPTTLSEPVATWTCTPGAPEEYAIKEEDTMEVTTYTTTCVPMVTPICTSQDRNVTTTVEWQECSEDTQPECILLPFRKPAQQRFHTLKCPLQP